MATYSRILVSLVKQLLHSIRFEVVQISTYAQQVSTINGLNAALEVFSNPTLDTDIEDDAELKDFIDFYRSHYSANSSQWSQDVFALWISNCLKGGSFLEIGAADGFTHSNTFSLERNYDWKGLLLEPDPQQYRILKYVRPKSTCRNTCISPEGLDDKTYKLRKFDQLSSLTGYEGLDMHYDARMQSKSFVNVVSESLNTILTVMLYDYFSLDVEGAELAILRSVDWSSVNKPRILTVEHNNRLQDKSMIIDILVSNGYTIYFDRYPWLTRGDIWASLGSCRG